MEHDIPLRLAAGTRMCRPGWPIGWDHFRLWPSRRKAYWVFFTQKEHHMFFGRHMQRRNDETLDRFHARLRELATNCAPRRHLSWTLLKYGRTISLFQALGRRGRSKIRPGDGRRAGPGGEKGEVGRGSFPCPLIFLYQTPLVLPSLSDRSDWPRARNRLWHYGNVRSANCETRKLSII